MPLQEVNQKKDGPGRPRKVDYEKVKTMHEAGCSYKTIARELSITKTTVHRILKNPYVPRSNN